MSNGAGALFVVGQSSREREREREKKKHRWERQEMGCVNWVSVRRLEEGLYMRAVEGSGVWASVDVDGGKLSVGSVVVAVCVCFQWCRLWAVLGLGV